MNTRHQSSEDADVVAVKGIWDREETSNSGEPCEHQTSVIRRCRRCSRQGHSGTERRHLTPENLVNTRHQSSEDADVVAVKGTLGTERRVTCLDEL